MSISLDEIIVSGEYRIDYNYNNLFKSFNLKLEEIEGNLYKFSELIPKISSIEMLIFSSEDYGVKWTCNLL